MREIKTGLDTVMYALPERIKTSIYALPQFIKNSAYEIRLREGGPLCITGPTSFYISADGLACTYLPSCPLIVTGEEIKETIRRITESSLYAREQELADGYLSMKNGNRAGISGLYSGGKLKKATSVNIRIAREVKGCAENLITEAEKGLLIVGPAGSGKTTLLRDLIRLLSYSGNRVAVIDTRGELCGGGLLDIGPNTDIISGTSKAHGCEMALRTLNPQYIAFDEVGNGGELALISESFFSGVKILTTAHASSINEIKSRSVTKALLDGSIGKLAVIESGVNGEITLKTPKEVLCYD
ncbi:MAG: Flp pilus assembly complex ATPase component TadA [Clostridia bacterium]|nr:Flp pilus assembly complex ATPase component TadA [Clostridia bacterium]